MQTFGRQSSTVLTTSLRVVSTVGAPVIEEFSYDEYLTGLPEHAVCAVVALEPWAGRSLLTFDTPTLLTVIDHLLGGPGTGEQPDRPLTEIEQALVRQLFERLSRAKDDQARALARRQAAERTQQRLSDVEVDVSVRFRPLRLASSRIATLAVGDVIPLGHRTTTPLAVTSAATTFASAVPGTSGAKLAVLIVPST